MLKNKEIRSKKKFFKMIIFYSLSVIGQVISHSQNTNGSNVSITIEIDYGSPANVWIAVNFINIENIVSFSTYVILKIILKI